MRARHFLALLAAAGLATAAGVGCDGNSDGTGGSAGDGGSGAGGDTGGTTTSTGGTTTTTTTTGTGGKGGDGNDSFETAEELPLAMEVAATLDPPAEDSDFYFFDGEADAPFIIQTSAKVGNDPFDPAYPDLVITLYDENKNQIARNDDPIPRFSNDPTLFTILPTAGKYYVEVAECSKVFGANNCADPANIEVNDYTITAGFLNDTADTIGAEAMEPNDMQAQATDATTKYLEIDNNPGLYAITTLYGRFQTTDDVDVFKFRLPANLSVDPGERSVGYFDLWPSGPEQDGSETKVGEVWITDDMGQIVAKIDNNVSATEDGAQSVAPPLMVDTDYYLFVKSSGGSDGKNDFYFMREFVAGSNPVEADDLLNNLPAGAEALTASVGDPTRYFFEGNISLDVDTDYFKAAVPSGLTDKTVAVFCGAERSGSGLRGFSVTLSNDADGTTIGSATESAKDDATVPATSYGNATTVRVEVKTTMMKDPAVSSDFYRCGLAFF